MAQETQYIANTGLVTISTANTSLTTGTIGTNIFTVLTAGHNGTLIKTVRIKAQSTPSQGMVRLWLYDGTNFRLIKEVVIYPIQRSGTDTSFESLVPMDLTIKRGYSLLASTQNADMFNIIAEGLDFTYFNNYVRPESTNYIANTGTASISTGTSSMTGSGSTLLYSVPAGFHGSKISSIKIKATAPTSADGMIRIFIYNGSSYFLLTEKFIRYRTQTGIYKSAQYTFNFPYKFHLQAGYSLYVSTQNSDSFHAVAEGVNWTYPEGYYQANYTPVGFSSTEVIIQAYYIPPGLISSGALLEVYGQLTVINNSHGKNIKIYINTVNSLSTGSPQAIAAYEAAFSVGDSFQRFFPIISDTSIECYGGSTITYPMARSQYIANSANTSTVITGLPSLSAGFWLLISGRNSSSLDTSSLIWSMVRKIS